MKLKQFLAALLCVTCLTPCIAGCTGPTTDESENTGDASEQTKSDITATISVEGFGDIKLELYPDIAPQSVRNFVYLAREGFYDGLIFHRIVNNFVIQGGGYDTDYNLKENGNRHIIGEFNANGIENDLPHDRGVISWARTSVFNSATSQFFICLDSSTTRTLDGQYAGFGRVIEGMDVVDAIAAVPLNGEQPIEDVVIKTVTVEGPELPAPDFVD